LTSGVYKVECSNGRIYVGSSINVHVRLMQHRHALEIERHDIKALQDDWNMLGSSSFTFKLVEEVAPEDRLLHEAEDRHISLIPRDRLYNKRQSAGRWAPQDKGPTYDPEAAATGMEEYAALIRSGAWHPRLTPPAEDIVKYLLPRLLEELEAGACDVHFAVPEAGRYVLRCRPVPWGEPQVVDVVRVDEERPV
jgi:hypothetical protein